MRRRSDSISCGTETAPSDFASIWAWGGSLRAIDLGVTERTQQAQEKLFRKKDEETLRQNHAVKFVSDENEV